jgi:formylglycine-generating enzyme required for sulfatase activity
VSRRDGRRDGRRPAGTQAGAYNPADAMTLPAGTRLGRYVVLAGLGAGGMAEVYLAEDRELGRRVALKLLPPETAGDEQARRRLTREARAAAALDHPHICAVYDVDEGAAGLFIAMQYVEGETLDARLHRSPLTVDEALALAVQIADGVAEAHAHGIIHRDLKPANVMVTPRGQAKVMDFGLAKPGRSDASAAEGDTRTASLLSTPGMVLGTWAYMSPEQVRGEPLDHRSDLFGLGVVLFEMVTGRRPFDDASPAAIASAILTREPPPLARFAPDAPAELERIVAKAMRKPVDARYQTAQDLLIDLRTLKEERDFQRRLQRTPTPHEPAPAPAEPPPVPVPPVTPVPAVGAPAAPLPAGPSAPAVHSPASSVRRPPRAVGAVAAVLLLAVAGAGGYAWRTTRATEAARAEAEAALPRLAALVEAGEHFDAYDLALQLEPVLGDDPRLRGLLPAISTTLTLTTRPEGARVRMRRLTATADASWHDVGVTPLTNVRIARGDYVLAIDKDGFAPIEQPVIARDLVDGNLRLPSPPVKAEHVLSPAGDVPPRMVLVPGGRYRLASWERPTDRAVDLGPFAIDKYEVSNAEFAEFVAAGGYLKREYWREPMVKDGQPLAWEAAMRLFVDRTGLPGPRGWANQAPPDGKADHPVAGVSWYEAAAYAVFRGKQLPTVWQWEKAARGTVPVPAVFTSMPWGPLARGEDAGVRANFVGRGTMPVTSHPFGMSPYGAYNMAGNVAEWTSNDTPDGYIATGGGWADPVYTFGQFGERPGTYSSDTIGLRLVRPSAGGGGDGGGRLEVAREVPKYAVVPEAEFRRLAEFYRYERAPLDARVEATETTADYTRETITFTGVRAERVTAYLYLPLHVPRPLQVLHYVPGGDVNSGFRPLPASMDERMVPFVKAGRAAFAVVLRGYIGGPPYEGPRPAPDSVERVEAVAERINTLRRGLDYLVTRPDVDRTRIVFVGPSAGAQLGLIEAALEDRYRAVVMIGAGLPKESTASHPAIDPVHFTPFIRVPKFVLQGRYDEDTPLRTASRPMFDLMREPKTMVLYDGGHVPAPDLQMRVVGAWLDERMGRVTR